MQDFFALVEFALLHAGVTVAVTLLHLFVVAPWLGVAFAGVRSNGVARLPVNFRPTDSFALARAPTILTPPAARSARSRRHNA